MPNKRSPWTGDVPDAVGDPQQTYWEKLAPEESVEEKPEPPLDLVDLMVQIQRRYELELRLEAFKNFVEITAEYGVEDDRVDIVLGALSSIYMRLCAKYVAVTGRSEAQFLELAKQCYAEVNDK